MKTSKYDKIDKELYLLFTYLRTSPILQQEAIEISGDLSVDEAASNFKGSEGWLSR